MDVLLEVEFNEFLTPKSCSLVIKQLIKYIVYNTQQIPYTYDGIVKLINCTKTSSESLENSCQSMKLMRANRLYKDIEKQFSNFESTFKYIEEELSKNQGIKEILLILGTTLLSPKHVFRIQIPHLSLEERLVDISSRKNLCNLYRRIIKDYDRIFSKSIGPTNTFILLQTDQKPSSDWFVPKHNFDISEKVNSIVFAFNTPNPDDSHDCDDTCEQNSQFEDSRLVGEQTVIHKPDCIERVEVAINTVHVVVDRSPLMWYQAKETIKGFKDFNIEGVSVFNMITDLSK